jgi:N-acetyl-anhydromuramyl-L-alanine amidase AmpD
MHLRKPTFGFLAALIAVTACTAHTTGPSSQPTPVSGIVSHPGEALARTGDEIIVCGQLFHTGGAPVVTWMDAGGFDAYRVERRFASFKDSNWAATTQAVKDLHAPNRFGLRFEHSLTADQIALVRGGGWPLPLLQEKVDQFVLHYDVCGTSRQCFNILHDHRGLSVHFMLDLDGTIYQTLDLKERAWHATTSNDRSIGIEIANIGAYGKGGEEGDSVLDQWYRKDADGHVRVVIPWALGGGRFLRTPGFVARPIREEAVAGEVQGHMLRMYDLTPQQYDSLIKLTATLCSVFPKITCDYPRDENGKLITHKLAAEQLAAYHGVLGHYHVQTDKTDPGPALQWDKVIEGAKGMMETTGGHGDKGTRG